MSTLTEFITAVGDDKAAELFRVKPRTAKSWRLGDRSPRPSQAEVIVRATATHSNGPVTYAGIYGKAA